MTLGTEQLETYRREGLLRIRQGVEDRDVRAMCTALWEALARKFGMHPERPGTWAIQRPTGLAETLPADAFARMASPVVVSALDTLLRSDWARPARWGVPLVCFPDPNTLWTVPHEQWHLDAPVSATEPRIARVFVVLAPLAPQGGGTVVVTGSHRLLQRLAAQNGKSLPSAQAKRLLWAQQPWLGALAAADAGDRTTRFMVEGCDIDGVHVKVAEMTGEPGDVYFMHPALLHAPAANVQRAPRLVLTQWIEAGVPT